MENETTAAAALGEELRRELETLRSELRSGIAGMHTDLKAMRRGMERMNTEVNSVQRDIHYFRLFTLHDVSGVRTALEGLRQRLDRRIEQRRALDDLGERIARLERAADREDLGTAAAS
jgi:predicted RNase H-like nuclease (RuvC/YqgF family)